ncbi:MAG: FAD binding domain-containing protein [Actinomycetota bacterium]|nr:FAD binding domain-containing protein [Actinomycetota bacterium]
MLRLPRFRYLRPQSVAEAAELMAEHGEQAMLVAGGTDLLPKMKRGQMEAEILVGLGHLAELRQLERSDDGGLRIGAGVTLSQIVHDAALARLYPGYVRAAALVSSPALRNAGTIGGNLCVDTRCNFYDQSYEWRMAVGFCMKKDGDICRVAPASKRCRAIASSDTAPAAMALGATVTLVSSAGRREVPVSALYEDDGQFYLAKAADEIIESIQLPAATDWSSSYVKVRRRGSIDFPLAGVAVALKAAGPVIEEGRIVITAVASRPLDVSEAAEPLVGCTLASLLEGQRDELLTGVAASAARPAKPLDNADLHYVWRKQMTRRGVEQAVREAATALLARSA